jgi:DNA-binding CsgD family transcriptional regulator
LTRQALADDRLVDEHGVWMWRGDMTVPPRLADLLDRRVDGLGPNALDALGALVLGEPLSLTTLNDVVSADGLAELEQRDIVQASERAGTVMYRFAHPMLAAAAARLITPTHRRRLADALASASESDIDVVRRAIWQLDGSGTPDVELLLAAARAVFLTRPALARRLAERAVHDDPSPNAALMVADACAELGQIDSARHAQTVAFERIRTDADLMVVRLNQVSLTAFSDRRPDLALEQLAAARAELPDEFRSELDSMAAQITVFSARPADALALAEAVLAASPTRACRIRASSVRVIALGFVDRTAESIAASEVLMADVAAGPVSPYAQGIAHVAALMARFLDWSQHSAPTTEAAGRWPVPAPGSDLIAQSETVFFPLFDGARRVIEGSVDRAIAPLREAVAQQRVGEGLLRSEAVALLVVALAATGQIDEATRLLAEVPPDRVALYPGLRAWAESTVQAAIASPTAVSLAFEAYEQARAAGSPISAVAYLAAAARYGAAARAAAVLDAWGYEFEAAISVLRAMSIRARANGDSKALLDAAERHADKRLVGDALALAELAVAGFGRDRSGALTRAKALVSEMRLRLQRPDTTAGPVASLTRREMEVATLAAKGMSDRDIGEVLVVSVRTVESHLAAIYRKLGISSRRGLRDALEPPAGSP